MFDRLRTAQDLFLLVRCTCIHQAMPGPPCDNITGYNLYPIYIVSQPMFHLSPDKDTNMRKFYLNQTHLLYLENFDWISCLEY